MKIVVTAGGIIWNESHPALQKYGNDVVIVRRTPDAAADLVARVGVDRNVLVLTDNDPRSFLPFQVLSGQFQSRRIHLFVCLPFSYESTRRKREILDLLSDFSKVKSLCLVELDAFLNGPEKDETLGGLQLRIRNGLIGLIDRAVAAMDGLDEFSRYRYDLSSDTYQKDDFHTLGDELAAKLLTKKKTEPADSGADCEAAAVRGQGSSETCEDGTGAEMTGTDPQEADGQAAPSPDRDAVPVPQPEQVTEEQNSKENLEETGETPPKAAVKKRRSLFAFLSRRKD